jgi:hypothetical protein
VAFATLSLKNQQKESEKQKANGQNDTDFSLGRQSDQA